MPQLTMFEKIELLHRLYPCVATFCRCLLLGTVAPVDKLCLFCTLLCLS